MTADPSHDDGLWAWVDEPDDLPDVPPGDVVTAVMVVRNGADWLGDALSSMTALDVRPGRLIVVDNGSTDGTREILDSHTDDWLQTVDGEAAWGFGRAVQAALESASASPPTQWLWLLHDDVVVRPDALRRLLEQTVRLPDADVLGPMLLRPTRRTQAARILELGVSISPTGRRELGLELDEVAQGQHEPADVLGVSTCGMLIRRSVYEELGGFDDAVPLYRDGVELGWRANLAGYRVVTCPAARITHRQAGRSGRRSETLATRAGRTAAAYDRTMALRTVSAHATGVMSVFVGLRLLVGSLLRTLGYLLGKRVDLASEELAAAGDFVRSGRAVKGLRRRVRALRPSQPASQRVKRLRPGFWSSWSVGLGEVARWLSERLRSFTTGPEAVTLDELTGDDFADRSSRRSSALVPLLFAFGALVLVLVAGRRMLDLGQVVSAGLLPAPDSVGGVFRAYLSPPLGLPGEHPAWLGLAALVSAPFVVPSWAVISGVLLGVPAAAVACAWYLEGYVRSVRVRWLAALLYALLPVLAGGYSRGQLWLVAWTVVLPMFGVALSSWGRGRGLDGWRAPAGAALSLTVLAALAPLALPLGAAVLAVVSIRRRAGLLRAILAVASAVALLLPWLPALVAHPGRLLTGPEPLLGTLTGAPAWEVFLARSTGPGLPPLWLSVAVAGLLWLGAAIALYLRPQGWGVWAGALGCLVLAALLSRPVVQVTGGPARPEVTMWLVAAFGVLLVGSAVAVDRARAELSESDFGLGQGLVLASTVVGALALALSLGWWVWGGVGAPLDRSEASSVPVYVRDAEVALGSRALLVDVRPDGLSWYVDEPGHPRWGDGETGLALGGSPDAVTAARTVVAQIASGQQVEGLAVELADLGVSHLRVSGGSADVVTALGSTPGLQRGTDDPSGSVWLVQGKPTRIQLRDGATTTYVTTGVEPGGSGRVLVLSEPPDPRRTVVVGGTELAATSSPDWRSAYDLGTAAGPLELGVGGGYPWWAWLQLVGLALLALFTAPSLQRDGEHAPVAAPRRASGPVGVLS